MDKQGTKEMEKREITNQPQPSAPPPPYDSQQGIVPYPAAVYPRVENDIEYPPESHEKVPLNPSFQNLGYQPSPQQGQYYLTQPQGMSQQQPPTVIFVQPTPLTDPPSSHLGYAIFTTACCCFIIGIFAIVRAVECRTAISTGNRPMAELHSRKARKLANIALGVGIVWILLVIVFQVLRGVFVANY